MQAEERSVPSSSTARSRTAGDVQRSADTASMRSTRSLEQSLARHNHCATVDVVIKRSTWSMRLMRYLVILLRSTASAAGAVFSCTLINYNNSFETSDVNKATGYKTNQGLEWQGQGQNFCLKTKAEA